MDDQLHRKIDTLYENLKQVTATPVDKKRSITDEHWIIHAICARSKALAASVEKTVSKSSSEIEMVVDLFLKWMQEGTVVRVIGAGRARLAASIPANRLAHGGARVFVQDDIIPMPHTVKGGGIIAASAS